MHFKEEENWIRYLSSNTWFIPLLLTGLLDAGCKIYKSEGFGGLYRGFWVSSVQIFSGVMYIATYEGARHLVAKNNIHNPQAKSMIAGAAASLVGQTIIVPFDVISQHLMVLGLATSANKPNKKVSLKISIF